MSNEPPSDVVLMHFGVKGMKWGVRKAKPDSSGVTRQAARQQKKADNKQLYRKLEDFQAAPDRSAQIRAARLNKRVAQRTYEDVKAEIKSKKGSGELGKNAASVALNKARNDRYETVFKADSMTRGEQFTAMVFNAVYDSSHH